MCGASSALTPGPVSRTRTTMDRSRVRSRALSMVTFPPLGVCFTAFARWFVRTRTMRPSSTKTLASCGSALSTWMPFASASGSTCATLRSASEEGVDHPEELADVRLRKSQELVELLTAGLELPHPDQLHERDDAVGEVPDVVAEHPDELFARLLHALEVAGRLSQLVLQSLGEDGAADAGGA